MVVDGEEIKSRVARALPDAQITIRDFAGDSDHFEMTVVSSTFEGKSTLQRHRLVYAPLMDLLGGRLHALSLKALTPRERDGA